VTGYGLDGGVQFPAGAMNFSLLHSVETGSGAHPASRSELIILLRVHCLMAKSVLPLSLSLYIYILVYILVMNMLGNLYIIIRLGRFTPREEAPDTHWIEVWVDPRAGLHEVE
jgi:hypothetical protein